MALFPPSVAGNSHPTRTVLGVPETVNLSGHSLRRSGSGRMTGAYLYLDLVDARSFELYLVRITHVDTAYLLAQALEAPALGVIRISRGGLAGSKAVSVGDKLLAGPLEFDADQMARMANAWRLPGGAAAPPPPAATARVVGLITRIHATGRFGEITTTAGKSLYFHVSQLQPGLAIHIGLRVSCVEVLVEHKGAMKWNANEVRAA